MATEAEIIIVRDNLPDEATGEGWDDAKISLMIDELGSTSRTIRQFWSNRSAATATFVNVNESGSSRNLSDIHKQALDMLKYWDSRIAEEEKPEVVESDGRIAFHRLKRV